MQYKAFYNILNWGIEFTIVASIKYTGVLKNQKEVFKTLMLGHLVRFFKLNFEIIESSLNFGKELKLLSTL